MEAFNKCNHNFDIIASNSIEHLNQDRIYYVSTGGSDNNDGLTLSNSFLTIQRALDEVYTLSNSKYTVTIRVGEGLYTTPISIHSSFGFDSNNVPLLIIEGVSSSLVNFQLNFNYGFCIQAIHNGAIVVKNITFTSNENTITQDNTSNKHAYLKANKGGYLSFSDCVFMNMPNIVPTSHLMATEGGHLNISGVYSILGNAQNHMLADGGIISANTTTAQVQNPSFLNFINSFSNSKIVLDKITYSGNCSGAIYNISADTNFTEPISFPTSPTEGIIKDLHTNTILTITPDTNDNSNTVPNTAWVNSFLDEKIQELEALIQQVTGQVSGLPIIPVGTIFAYCGAAAPGGYLLCNGQEVSRTQYARLFNVIGTLWGVGNSTTTFNLPDYRGRVLVGSNPAPNSIPGISNYPLANKGGKETSTLNLTNLPEHKHDLEVKGHTHGIADPGHLHSIVDKQHNHNMLTGRGDPGSSVILGTGTGSYSSQSSFTGINTTEKGYSSIQVENSYENISMKNAGGGQPISLMQPYSAVTWIIKH